MKRQEFIQLRNEWMTFKEKEGKNLRGITIDSYQGTLQQNKARDERKKHLVGLLKIYRKQMEQNPSVYQDVSNGTVSFEKMHNLIIHRIIKTYRYNGFKPHEISFKDKNDQDWYENLLKSKKKQVPRRPFSMSIESLKYWETDFEACLKVFNQRIWDLAEIFNYFHKLIEDVKQSDLPLLYGTKFSGLRSWLGQEFLRQSLGKDISFHSSNTSSASKVKEHWSCNSLPRDIVMFKSSSEWDVQKWYETIRYNYRIVNISREEDSRLERKGWRSSRPLDAYEQCGIEIHPNEQELWEKIYESQLDF